MENYLSKGKLKERGWTESLIKRFLPSSEITRPNPHYKNASPMCFYAVEKVLGVECSIEFKVAMEASQKRKKTAKKAVDIKKKNVIEWVESLVIEIPDYDKELLVEEACKHYNARKQYQKELYDEWASRHYDEICENYEPDFSLATPKSDEKFIARISTNYLRHCCSDYEKRLSSLFGKTGKDEGHDLLKSRINDAIHKKYPWTAVNG